MTKEETFYLWLQNNHKNIDLTESYFLLGTLNDYGNKYWWSNSNNLFSISDPNHVSGIKKKIKYDQDFKNFLYHIGKHSAVKLEILLSYYMEYLSTPEKTPVIDDPLLQFLKDNNISYTDLRSKGNSLWVPGGSELEFALKVAEKKYQIVFKHIKNARAYSQREGWYTFDKAKEIFIQNEFLSCMAFVTDLELRELGNLTKRKVIVKLYNSGRIINLVTEVYRDKEYDIDLLSQKEYGRIKAKGAILAHIITLDRWKQLRTRQEFTDGLFAQDSILKQLGYTVNQKAGLSDFQREKIIDFAINQRLTDKQAVLNLLGWLVFMASRKDELNGTDHMEHAIMVWKKDMEYISNNKFRY